LLTLGIKRLSFSDCIKGIPLLGQAFELQVSLCQLFLRVGVLWVSIDGALRGRRSLLCLNNLAGNVLISTNVLDRICCCSSLTTNRLPCLLPKRQVFGDLMAAILDRVDKSVGEQLGSPYGVTLLFQGDDLRVSGRSQEIVLFVQVLGCRDRVLADLHELGDGILHRTARGITPIERSLGNLDKAVGGDLAAASQLSQHFRCSAGGANGGRYLGSHSRQAIGSGARRVTGGDEGLLKADCFLTALVVRVSQDAQGSCCYRERIHQAQNVTAESLYRRTHPAKHVFELTTLLEQHGQRSLAAL
jgi:hypothetical protein